MNPIFAVQGTIYCMKAIYNIWWHACLVHNICRILCLIQSGCTSSPMWCLAYFFRSLPNIDILLSSFNITCLHWLSVHEMCRFIQCIRFRRYNRFFEGILYFRLISVSLLHKVLKLTKIPDKLSSLLMAADDIHLSPIHIYFTFLSSKTAVHVSRPI